MTDQRYPPPGFFILASADPPLRVLGRLASGPVTVESGFGGWGTTPHPRNRATVSWEGHEPFRLRVPFWLDGLGSNAIQDGFVSNLQRMARREPGNDQPSTVKIYGYGIPERWRTFVIEELEETNDSIKDQLGRWIRYSGEMVLLEYVIEKRLARLAKRNSKRGKNNTHKRYTVRNGDTLQRIAAKHLGSSKKWREIWKLNKAKLKDPNQIRVGQVLRLP